MIEVRVPGHPPGGNELHRMGHWGIRKSRETWKDATHTAAVRAMASGPFARPWMLTAVGRSGRSPDSTSYVPDQGEWWPLTRASLEVTWRYKIRRNRDLDNLVAGLKPMIDGLVSAGILEDDHSGVLVSLGPFRVEVGAEQDETVLRVHRED